MIPTYRRNPGLEKESGGDHGTMKMTMATQVEKTRVLRMISPTVK